MTPDTAALVVELTRDLSEARAMAHHYRELFLMTLALDGATQRENRHIERRLKHVTTMRRGESLGLDA